MPSLWCRDPFLPDLGFLQIESAMGSSFSLQCKGFAASKLELPKRQEVIGVIWLSHHSANGRVAFPGDESGLFDFRFGRRKELSPNLKPGGLFVEFELCRWRQFC